MRNIQINTLNNTASVDAKIVTSNIVNKIEKFVVEVKRYKKLFYLINHIFILYCIVFFIISHNPIFLFNDFFLHQHFSIF